MEFVPGNLVRLKSGGPLMTVEKIERTMTSSSAEVWCVWSEKVGPRNEVKRDTFAPVLLETSSRGIGSVALSRG